MAVPSRIRSVIAALSSATLTLVLVLGVPLALLGFVGNPLPAGVPSMRSIGDAVTNGLVPDRFWIGLLAIVVWVAWLQLMVALLVEVVAALRGIQAPTLAGFGAAQGLAGRLVAQMTMLTSLLLTTPAITAAMPAMPAHAAPTALADSVVPSVAEPNAGPTVTVARRDTLFRLAEVNLGSSDRWETIRDANVGRVMPDGTVLPFGFTSLQAGWTLVIPGAVASPTVPELTLVAGGLADADGFVIGSHVVSEGDHFWGIAESVLTEAYGRPVTNGEIVPYWAALVDANADLLMSGDPDLIHPTERLDIVLPPLPPGMTFGEARTMTSPRPVTSLDDTPPVPAEVESPPPAPDIVVEESAVPEPLYEAAEVPVVASPAEPVDDAAADDNDVESAAPSGLSTVAFGVSGVLLATGAAGLLRRRRRVRMAARDPGERPARPPKRLAKVEAELHADSDEDTAAWIHAAIQSTAARPLTPGVPVAQPELFLVGDSLLEVMMSSEAPAAPAPWEARAEGRIWELARETPISELPAVAGSGRVAPVLVTIGENLALNLEAVGLLCITGADDRVAGLIRSMVHELSVGPAAAIVDIRSTAPVPGTDAYDMVSVTTTDALVDELVPWLDDLDSRMTEADLDNVYALRAGAAGADPISPIVVVCTADEADALSSVLSRAGERRYPLAVVVAGRVPDANYQAAIDDVGELVLAPHGLRADAQYLPATTATDIGDLIASTEQMESFDPFTSDGLDDECADLEPPELDEDDDLPTDVSNDPEPVEDGADSQPDEASVALSSVMVRVLGPVDIVGIDKPLSAQELSLVTYLAIVGPSPADKIKDALWPTRIPSDSRWAALITSTRKKLGRHHLPEATDGTYRLVDVTTDLDVLRSMVAAAGTDPTEAVPRLVDAVALIRGEPFSGTQGRFWQWTFDHVIGLASTAEIAAANAAMQLADHALAIDDLDLAAEACLAGGRAAPHSEQLVSRLADVYRQLGQAGAAKSLLDDWERRIDALT